MASKKTADKSKADPFASFDAGFTPKSKAKASTSSPAKDAASSSSAAPAAAVDPVAELESVAKGSRPQTPRPGSSAAGKKPAAAGTSTPAKKSMEEAAAPAAAQEAATEKVQPAEQAGSTQPDAAEAAAGGGGGGGWWGGFGGLMGAASAAVKQAQTQAEQLAKELQNNEEAQKWVEHAKGNAALLRSYDLRQITGEIRSRALPGLTNLLHTLAPPISSHERLQVHITHDMTGYPSLDPLVHAVFTRVMAQVEGGDLLVLQRGSGSGPKSPDDKQSTAPSAFSSSAGWSDGPWWRDLTQRRDIGAVPGLVEGSKLARASAEGFADEYFARLGGIDEARTKANEAALSESNPTRSSDIFLAVQAVTREKPAELFAGGGSSSSSKEKEKEKEGAAASEAAEAEADADSEILFAVYLHDPVHSLAFGATTQALPQKWVRGWLDLPEAVVTENARAPELGTAYLPPDIADLVAAGGLDPREWAAEWVEEALALAVGVVAQRYVARRMGVGEPAASDHIPIQGNRPAKAEEAGAGELARAM